MSNIKDIYSEKKFYDPFLWMWFNCLKLQSQGVGQEGKKIYVLYVLGNKMQLGFLGAL